jgi:hypothetical protein
LSLSALAQPLYGHASAIDLLELINAHNAPSKEVPGNGLHKNKKLKQPRSKLSAIKKMYVKAKLIAAKPINYVVNGKFFSAKNVFYGVAGLASFLLVVHGYKYIFDFEHIEAPHNDKKSPIIPVLADDFPCQTPVVQGDTELPIPQISDNSEQLVNQKVEQPIDQQESVYTETPDKPDNPEHVINETPEELKNSDVPQDVQEKNQQSVGSADNSGGPLYLAVAGGAVVVTSLAAGCLFTFADEIISAIQW